MRNVLKNLINGLVFHIDVDAGQLTTWDGRHLADISIQAVEGNRVEFKYQGYRIKGEILDGRLTSYALTPAAKWRNRRAVSLLAV